MVFVIPIHLLINKDVMLCSKKKVPDTYLAK